MRFSRNNIWAFVGVFVSLLSIASSTYVAYDIFYKQKNSTAYLTIDETLNSDVTIVMDYLFENSNYNIRGENLDNLFITGYKITNSHSMPITPEDFIEPLKYTTLDGWSVVDIDTVGTQPNNLNIEWEKTGPRACEMVPTLLNLGDSFNILILLSNESYNNEEIQNDHNFMGQWSSRIKNIIDIKYNPLYQENYIGPVVVLYGMNLYFVLFLTLLLSFFTVLVIIKRGVIKKISFKDTIIIIFAFVISLASSEVIGFYLFDQEGRIGFWINFPIIITHTILLILMLFPIIIKNIRANQRVYSDARKPAARR